jgi:hypothetical protein
LPAIIGLRALALMVLIVAVFSTGNAMLGTWLCVMPGVSRTYA